MTNIKESDVMNALKRVNDPELNRSIVELGMVRDLVIEDGVVSFTLALTIPECPLRDQLSEDAHRAVKSLPGVKNVLITLGAMSDQERAAAYRARAADLSGAIERYAWDGEWFLRAFYDDGSRLGSAQNRECQIDSIAQSWSVLSGVGSAERAQAAMEAVDQRLVRRDAGLIQLLDPPFDHTDLDPGYINGYVPGVRENGGQYTHGAIWAAMAFAALGDSQRAWELTTMINPANHAKAQEAIATYKVEPYVMAADVYAAAPHIGRGGWTWYTGSAGWMYRLILESLLGLQLKVDRLHLAPCLPAHWQGLTIHYRFRETVYHIAVSQTSAGEDGKRGVTRVTVDGIEQEDLAIGLVDDHEEHAVEVWVRAKAPAQGDA